MSSGSQTKGRDNGPRKFAYNIDAAREREMHLYAKPEREILP